MKYKVKSIETTEQKSVGKEMHCFSEKPQNLSRTYNKGENLQLPH